MIQKTLLTLAFLVPLCAALSAQQNYYSVKFPDDRMVVGCGAYPDTSDVPIIQNYLNCSFNVGISVHDQAFNLNATGGCKKILRTWRLIWWCDYNPNWPAPTFIPNPGNTDVGPTVFGDSNNHGYLEYVQIIKVVDNQPPVFLNCPDTPLLFCDYTNNDPAQYGSRCEGPVDLKVKVTDVCSKWDVNLSYRLYLDLDGNGTMETYRSSSAPDAWVIERTIVADTVSAKVKLPAGVGLPYGKHKIEWIATDGCGNQTLCKYEFEVKDCKAPTVVCHHGLSVNMMPTGMITIWATDFLKSVVDNCTPTPLIKIAIQKAGVTTTFPAGVTSLTFDCNEVGKQFVELWAEDEYGNADFCQTYIIVQDNFGVCAPTGTVSGTISNDKQQPLPGVKVQLKNNLTPAQQSSTVTNAAGKFLFAGAPGTCNYSIIPQFDTLPQLGVNTLDVLLSDWHISGQALLPTPYKIVAADVNHDGLLNSLDLDAMNNLIIGSATAFPNNTAWRFVPAAYSFPATLNPLTVAFPEKISTTCPAPSGDNQHFVAIKTGDVDGSADPANTLTATSENRSAEGKPYLFQVVNKRFEAGDDVTATLTAPDLSTLLGFQFTLYANQNMLALQSAEPLLNERLNISTEHNRVALSWYTRPGENSGSRPVITLKFKALQSGSLKQALQFNSSITNAEAYDTGRNTMDVAIMFVQAISPNQLSVSPNPTSGPLTAEFFLPENAKVKLSLSDLNGERISDEENFYEAGWHKVNMPLSASRASGIYILRLDTPAGSETRRVMLNR